MLLSLFVENLFFTFSSISFILILGSIIIFYISLEEILLYNFNQLEQLSLQQYMRYKTTSNNIEQYEQLLKQLKQFGRYQIRLIAIMVLYWFISGVYEGLFQLSIAWNEQEIQFYIQEFIQIVNIIIFTYVSSYIGRYNVNIINTIIFSIGCILLQAGISFEIGIIKNIGIFIVVSFHYTLAFSIFMILLEYHKIKQYPKIWIFAMVGLILGKLSVVFFQQSLSSALSYYVIFPSCVIYIVSLFFYGQSPRYLIDTNIQKAQLLLKNMAQVNKLRHEDISLIMQRQFFWNKVNLKKYGITTLYKNNSVNYNTYYIIISLLLLGIICRCPDLIQHLQSKTSFQFEDSVEIIWISLFQLCGLFPSYLSANVLKRKTILIALSIVLLFISFLLALLESISFYLGDALLYSMIIFGLNSFFAVALFYFLILTALEFYPHTIRTMACGLIIASYKLGKMLFSLHIQVLHRNSLMLQLVVSCSILLVLHCCIITETFNISGKYELTQIQQEEGEDF